jgi:hypothetical protein
VKYDELKIRIEREDGGYRVHASSPCGDATARFTPPFEDVELENFVLRVGRSARGMRRIESSDRQRLVEFGGRLFNALFESQVKELYVASFVSRS